MALCLSFILFILPTCFASNYDENPVTVNFEVNNTGAAGLQVFESRIAAPYGNTAYSDSTRIYYANGTPVEAFWHPYTTNDIKFVLLIRADLAAGVNNFILTTGSPNSTSVQDIENVTTLRAENVTGANTTYTLSETSNWAFMDSSFRPDSFPTSKIFRATFNDSNLNTSSDIIHNSSSTNVSNDADTNSKYSIESDAHEMLTGIGASNRSNINGGGIADIRTSTLYSPFGSESFGIRLYTSGPYNSTMSPLIVSASTHFEFSVDSVRALQTGTQTSNFNISVSNISKNTTTVETQISFDKSSDLKSFVFINMFNNSQYISTTTDFMDNMFGSVTRSPSSVTNTTLLTGNATYGQTITAPVGAGNNSSFFAKQENNTSRYSSNTELANFSTSNHVFTHRTLSTYSEERDFYYNYTHVVFNLGASSSTTNGSYNFSTIPEDLLIYNIPLLPHDISNNSANNSYIWSNTRTHAYLYNTAGTALAINPYQMTGTNFLNIQTNQVGSAFFNNSDVSYQNIQGLPGKAIYFLKQGEHTVNLTIRDQNTKELIYSVTGFLDDAQIVRSTDTGTLRYQNVTDGWHHIILQAQNYTQTTREFYIDENQTNVTLYMSGGNQSGSGGDVLVSPNYVTFRVVNQLGNGIQNYTVKIEDINDPASPVTFIDLNVQNSDTFYASIDRTTNYKVTVTANNGSWTKEHYIYGAEDYAYYVIMVQDGTIEPQGDIFTNYSRSWAVNATNYTLTIAPVNDTISRAYLIGTGESTLYNLDTNSSITVTPMVSYQGETMILSYPNGFQNSSLRWDIQINTVEDAPRGFRFSGTETWTSSSEIDNKLPLGLTDGTYSALSIIITIALTWIFANARITWAAPIIGVLSIMLFIYLGWFTLGPWELLLLGIGVIIVVLEMIKKDKTNFG